MKVKKYIYLSFISILLVFFSACTNDVASDSPAQEKKDNPPQEVPEEKIVFEGTPYTVIPSDNPNFNGSYALFGDWPQTIKADDVTVDETISVQMGGFTYYMGSDGAWYAKCVENACTKTGIPVYTNGNRVGVIDAHTEKYFKVEPIKWRILDPRAGGKMSMLMSDKPLMADIIYNVNIVRQLGEKTIYPNNYKYSNMRAYLNGIPNQFITDGGNATEDDIDWTGKGFLQTAFTEALQDTIQDTEINNSITSANPDKDTALNDGKNPFVCDKTKDKIFLLSLQEATAAGYGFAKYSEKDKFRLLVPTDFAKANNAFCYMREQSSGNPPSTTYWFLRTPDYSNQNWVKDFDYEGKQLESNIEIGDSTIVPALCLK